MSLPKLTYFDMAASRGEECRLAFVIAGVPFEDRRIKREDWPAMKPTTPFGSLPVLELPGHPPLAQSNAILVLIGRLHGLHPIDPYEAARHEAMMAHVEDLRANVSPTMRLKDEAEKKAAREALAENYIPVWGKHAEAQLGDGPFFGGLRPNVVDTKIHMTLRWFKGGALDHIPATVLDAFPKLNRVHDAVRDLEAVKAWYAR
jgi:glutathione S-transferase